MNKTRLNPRLGIKESHFLDQDPIMQTNQALIEKLKLQNEIVECTLRNYSGRDPLDISEELVTKGKIMNPLLDVVNKTIQQLTKQNLSLKKIIEIIMNEVELIPNIGNTKQKKDWFRTLEESRKIYYEQKGWISELNALKSTLEQHISSTENIESINNFLQLFISAFTDLRLKDYSEFRSSILNEDYSLKKYFTEEEREQEENPANVCEEENPANIGEKEISGKEEVDNVIIIDC